MVRSYNEYLRLLENAIVQNGRKELKRDQIDIFIRLNNLDTDWGIVFSEVKKDMDTILIKYRAPINNTPRPVMRPRFPNVGSNIGRSTSSTTKQVKDYDSYMYLLESAMQKNANGELSDTLIQHFISVNKLDSDWGITPFEIRKDMKTIQAKLARYERTASTSCKHVGVQSVVASYQNSEVHSNIQNSEKKKSGLTEEDKNIVLLLRDMLIEYPDISENSRRLKAAIADILPGKKKEVNLLGTLAEENIIRAIEIKQSLDQMLCDRFVSILEEEYGTSIELARRMVLIWFHAYGRLILNKNIDLR